MKRLVWFLLCGAAIAQNCGTTTSGLSLNLPAYNAPGWNICLNNNWTSVDNYLSGVSILPAFKAAALTLSGTGLTSTAGTFSTTLNVTGNTTLGGTLGVTGAFTGNSTGTFSTSLAINGGTALTTTNQTGTGSLTMATSPTVSHPTINTGIANNGTGFQHVRIASTLGGSCPTAASAGATCTSAAINWGTAFADTNYTLVCTLDGHTNQPHIVSTSKAAGNFQVLIAADTAAAADGGIDCIGVHD